MQTIVLEKEKRLKSIMQMHGLKETHYWAVSFFSNFSLYLCIYGASYLVGRYLFNMAIFTDTSGEVMNSINILWGVNQIGLGIILQTFFSSTKTATIMGYTLQAVVQLCTMYASVQLYLLPNQIPHYLYLIPQMTFTRLYYFMSIKCFESRCYSRLTELTGEPLYCFLYFVATALLYPLIGVLLNNVSFIKKKREATEKVGSTNKHNDSDDDQFTSLEMDSRIFSGELSDVEEEKNKTQKVNNPKEYPILIKGVSKTYKLNGKYFEALKSTHLSVAKGEVLGLLGPNGAGKTTLISILTGLIKPSSGTAWVGGYNIHKELPNVYKSIGVCPQFDLFWEDLTIEEHLLFYLRLKGCDARREDEKVRTVCKQVELQDHAKKQAKHLSGGMKRRLSLAISLIGDPDVIFLDEPTTGLDPLNREVFWKILEKVKGNKSIILTTHLMQEADFLSDRIGRWPW